ncbi:heme biosynthesis HemY N-terminal domain-containing protein [Paralcaligenes ureilyticus]|uniref:HemY protein n=1 Tax=Paralcaligenes ureilyticus TaxID=627131 RepID=A0A4R3LZ88_9BURK|nr:heme biosynthesis HemY N-terminal domain-containing protein [Paralcaligenes ureilyticus]TCT04085.1 HemY protein [Paralcaligenes ureilyticus]
MRTWFWSVVFLALAVGLALVLREHGGNVLIVAQPWRIELSITFAVLLLLAVFFLLYVVIRLLAWLTSSPERFRLWRGVRAQKRDHDWLETGWVNLLEGRYTQAERDFSKVLTQSRSPNRKVLAALAAARASHRLGEFVRRDDALQIARENAGSEPRLKEAAATVAAEMYLDQNRPNEALRLLQPLQDASSRYFHATRLLLRAHQQLHNHDRVYDLTRLLLRRGVIDKAEALSYLETAVAARLHKGGLAGFKTIWGDLKSDERVLPEIALAGAAIQESAGNIDEASKILEAAINVKFEPRLLSAYSQCPPEQVARRLSKAEVWLKSKPDDSALLAMLGNLCLTGQLWGQGERYLLRSMKIRSDVRIHALLGNLYDRLGRRADAMKHWRLASGVAGVLPVLAANRALPAADTRGDPTLIAFANMPETDLAGEGQEVIPQAASAADYVVEHEGKPAAEVLAPVSGGFGSKSAEPDFDEYFDSAPIPGVDLSQTSDRPSDRSKNR